MESQDKAGIGGIFEIMENWGVKIISSLKSLASNGSPLGDFLISAKNRMGIGSPERNATDTYERGMKIVPECISANENEIPVKQYNIAVLRNLLKFERAEGRMQITNKRAIFRAAGRSVRGRTTLQYEFAINEIAGIEARNNYKFSFIYLIFAFLIISLASLIIYQTPFNYSIVPPRFSVMDLDFSLPRMARNESRERRIYSIMYPAHIQKAFENEGIALYQAKQAQEKLDEAKELTESAKEEENTAKNNAQNGILKTRRIRTGYDWWGNPTFRNETYRDTSEEGLKEAQDLLNAAVAEREKAEREEQTALTELETAKTNEANAIKKRINAVNIWRVLMTIVGIIIGIIGLLPFFMLNKKFGIKLFLLNFAVFGFTLSLFASDLRFFNIFIYLSNIILIICVFLYCFRPNLVISIKNKGAADTPVNIRRDTWFVKRKEKGTGFREIIPTDETESAIREMGAIITDIQNQGDLGIQKWIK